MNLSHGGGGYGSDAVSQKSNNQFQQKQPNSILSQDVGPSKISNSAGGIEDLQHWLKNDSSKKYDESCNKLGLDNSKIAGKHLVSYSLDEL